MQNKQNCHENVWILSGTADGPSLARRLLKHNYRVFASVVTQRGSESYIKNSKLHIITGRLNDKSEVINFIKKNKIKFVIDATHPFAQIISRNLNAACKEINAPLFVFERKSTFKEEPKFNYISDLKGIKNINLIGKNILLAIGSRFLNDTAKYYLESGADVYTRILPTQESVSRAFGSVIKNSNIAILEPSKRKDSIVEKKLCDFWKIDYVLCRESGSYSQKKLGTYYLRK